MNKQMLTRGLMSAGALFLLTGCGTSNEDQASESSAQPESSVQSESSSESSSGMMNMEHDESGELPEGIQEAENPEYAVGDEVTIQTDHMMGMNGAQGEIVGAFDTVAYEVSYTPTNGGDPVMNHKWVVQEEIADSGNDIIEDGTDVTLEAFHMEGMEGAEATIESSNDTIVYMIDYQPTNGGEVVKNHKWVTEDELAPAE